jgi:hypothetical protein
VVIEEQDPRKGRAREREKRDEKKTISAHRALIMP